LPKSRDWVDQRPRQPSRRAQWPAGLRRTSRSEARESDDIPIHDPQRRGAIQQLLTSHLPVTGWRSVHGRPPHALNSLLACTCVAPADHDPIRVSSERRGSGEILSVQCQQRLKKPSIYDGLNKCARTELTNRYERFQTDPFPRLFGRAGEREGVSVRRGSRYCTRLYGMVG
jgi:hypothetical protein